MTSNWNNNKTKELFSVFLTFKTTQEVANFCRDLMTESEIEEFASRWEVAKELSLGKTQRDIANRTKVSIATVTRVNQWLNRGMNGYKLALKNINIKNHPDQHQADH